MEWDRETVRRMREGERQIAMYRWEHHRQHAEIMGHRCYVLMISRRFEEAGTCLRDMRARHPDAVGTIALWGAALADMGNRDGSMDLFLRLAGNAKAPAGLRYDANKWLVSLLLARGDTAEARKRAAAALEHRPQVVRFGQRLDYKFVVLGGAFMIGLNTGPDGEAYHSVDLSAEAWSIIPAPADDAKLKDFVTQ